MLDDLFNLLQLLFRYEGLAELLQVHGRAVIRSDWLDFVACQNVVEHFLEFEAIEELREQARAHRRLLLDISEFRLDCLYGFQQPGMSLDGFRVGWVVAKGDAGLAEEFLEKLIHGFEAVGVARIVAQQDVMLQKKNVVFAAVKKNQP